MFVILDQSKRFYIHEDANLEGSQNLTFPHHYFCSSSPENVSFGFHNLKKILLWKNQFESLIHDFK